VSLWALWQHVCFVCGSFLFAFQLFLGWCADRWNINGIAWSLLLLDEWLVFADLLWPLGWHVLVVVGAVDDLVINHMGEVLETVELDLTMAVVVLERVVAGAAGAR
jgi:hypothetical protein